MTETIEKTVNLTARGDGEKRERFGLSKVGFASALVIAFWLLMALIGPIVAPYTEAEFVSYDSYLPIFGEFALGTDYLGRDMLSRILYGARLTLFMAVTATLIASTVGSFLGMFAAIKGGWIDTVLSRLNDSLLSFPTIMMGLVVVAALGSSVPVLVATTGLIYSSSVFRIARALAADQVVMDYVEITKGRGEGTSWILFQEILPNIIVPLVVDFGIRLSFAILFMSSLSFLGLGVQPPYADWGGLVRENLTGLTSQSIAPILPALAISSLTVAINLIVDDFSAKSGKGMAENLE
jgi:peptide/nickel transport system permease protein